MIDDSVPWKEDLLRLAQRLQSKAAQQRWVERTGYLVERDIMIGAFSVRKLVESKKISGEVEQMRWPVTRHLLAGPVPDAWNRWSYWESFDLERGQQTTLKTVELCNVVVHSFVFGFNGDEVTGLWDGIFVTSDWKRRECLYFVPVESLTGLFQAVGADDVVTARLVRDKQAEMRIVGLSNALTEP